MRPLIGITPELQPDMIEGRGWQSTTLLTGYALGIIDAGGIPVILPLASASVAGDTLSRLDGLVLSGGLDIPAEILGEPPHPKCEPMLAERWPSERLWLETALELEKPVLGICLGMQVMNVVAGGGLIQDIPSQWPEAIKHSRRDGMHRHKVTIDEGTRLARMAPHRTVEITSSHHQAVKDVPPGYRRAAVGPDGIIEAIERADRDFVIGVQWHPERGPEKPDWLLKAFVERCGHACPKQQD